MMAPPSPCAIIVGMNALQVRYIPLRLMFITSSQSSSGVSWTSHQLPGIPATVASTSTRPNLSSTASRMPSSWSKALRSSGHPAAVRPIASISPQTERVSGPSSAATATSAPARANPSDTCRPIPTAPPVTTATFPERSIVLVSSKRAGGTLANRRGAFNAKARTRYAAARAGAAGTSRGPAEVAGRRWAGADEAAGEGAGGTGAGRSLPYAASAPASYPPEGEAGGWITMSRGNRQANRLPQPGSLSISRSPS